MQTLHVRSIPDKLYERLRTLARAKHRSLSAQVIVMLTRAAEEEAEQEEMAQALDYIHEHRFTPPPTAPDSTEMLREDRDR